MRIHRLGLSVASWFLTVQSLLAINVFFAPRLTLETGYDDNRFGVPASFTNMESSAFLRTTPALNLHFLCDNGSELVLGASASRMEYLRSNLDHRDDANAYLEWWRVSVPLEGGLRLAGGFARDAAVPEDDLFWFAAIPTLRYALPAPEWQLNMQIRLDLVDYDSRLTANGDAQRDTAAEIRPGLRWIPSRDLSVWSEFYLEANESNEDSAGYTGAGLAFGASYWLSPRNQLDASVQTGARTFEAYPDAAGAMIDRRDTPLSVHVVFTHRLCPWLDIFCAASWQTTGSNQSDQDTDSGTILIGTTFAQDFELFPASR